MKRAVLCVAAIVLIASCGGLSTSGQADSVAPTLRSEQLLAVWKGLAKEQRLAVSRLLTDKYPDLAPQLASFIDECEPKFFAEVSGHLQRLIVTKYQGLPGVVCTELSHAPEAQSAVEEMIRDKYPELIADLEALPAGEDLPAHAAQIIQQQYPTLLNDMVTTIHQNFPSVLRQMQHRLVADFSDLVADVATIVGKDYPELGQKSLDFIMPRYPDLTGDVLSILMQPLTEPAEGSSTDDTTGGETTTIP